MEMHRITVEIQYLTVAAMPLAVASGRNGVELCNCIVDKRPESVAPCNFNGTEGSIPVQVCSSFSGTDLLSSSWLGCGLWPVAPPVGRWVA